MLLGWLPTPLKAAGMLPRMDILYENAFQSDVPRAAGLGSSRHARVAAAAPL